MWPFGTVLRRVVSNRLVLRWLKTVVVSDVVESTRGGGGLNVVFDVARELRPWRAEPVVADVYDRLLSLMSAA